MELAKDSNNRTDAVLLNSFLFENRLESYLAIGHRLEELSGVTHP